MAYTSIYKIFYLHLFTKSNVTKSSQESLSQSWSLGCCKNHNSHTCDIASEIVCCPFDHSRYTEYPDNGSCIPLEVPQQPAKHQACQNTQPYLLKIYCKLDRYSDCKCTPDRYWENMRSKSQCKRGYKEHCIFLSYIFLKV
jgi:hypothetical protein